MINKKIFPIFLIFVIIFTIEFLSFVASSLNLLIFNDAPAVYLKKPKQNLKNYWNEKEVWGAWHEKNFQVRHVKECFDIEYKTNEVGARDDSFIKTNNEDNIVLLGDSFAEGYGIEKNNMFETKIENLTDKTVLNFSSSKDFGLIQYILIYENLAKNYNHSSIIISFLPNNDFKDNDFIFYKENKLDFLNNKQRHRPYYIKSENGYKILFPKKKNERNLDLINISKNYFWSSNILRTIKYLYISNKLKKAKKKLLTNDSKEKKTQHITDYYFTPQYQQEAIIFFLQKFIKENSKKNIILFSIPLYEDYEIVKNNDYRDEIFWWKKIKSFQYKYKNFHFLDLIDYATENYKDYFFPNKCDGHWNKKGHQWAGEIISEYLSEFDVLK